LEIPYPRGSRISRFWENDPLEAPGGVNDGVEINGFQKGQAAWITSDEDVLEKCPFRNPHRKNMFFEHVPLKKKPSKVIFSFRIIKKFFFNSRSLYSRVPSGVFFGSGSASKEKIVRS